MRITLRLFLFLILVICFSCEEQGYIVNCPDCTAEEPIETNLEIKLELNYSSTMTLIKVYEGNLEDSILNSSYQISGTRTSIPLTINKKYTVTATYYLQGDYYIAVDSATPRVR